MIVDFASVKVGHRQALILAKPQLNAQLGFCLWGQALSRRLATATLRQSKAALRTVSTSAARQAARCCGAPPSSPCQHTLLFVSRSCVANPASWAFKGRCGAYAKIALFWSRRYTEIAPM